MFNRKAPLVVAVFAMAIFAASAVAPDAHETSAGFAPSNRIVRYGDDPAQFGRLVLPGGSAEPAPVVMFIHGGFWKREIGDLSLMDELVDRVAADGYAVWNIEYGRVGEQAGGWPHTFDHVARAIDHLASIEGDRVDLEQVFVVGHSAGGHLALWLRTRGELSGQRPVVDPAGVIALAPVVDLEAASASGLGNGAVDGLLGGAPVDVPDRYRYAAVTSPSDIPALVVVSEADTAVPAAFSRGVEGNVTMSMLDAPSHLDLIRGDGVAAYALLEELRKRSTLPP